MIFPFMHIIFYYASDELTYKHLYVTCLCKYAQTVSAMNTGNPNASEVGLSRTETICSALKTELLEGVLLAGQWNQKKWGRQLLMVKKCYKY